MPEPTPEVVEALFLEAADLNPQQRLAYLDEHCASDPALRAAVEELLHFDEKARNSPEFLRSPATEISAALPASLGRYRVLQRLGEGGMGTVYEAEQDEPKRTVALKILRPDLDSPDHRKRFAREARILGQLHHVGIAQVYDTGATEDGRLYFAMELIRGLPLNTYVRHHIPGIHARLELMARICDAVQHAHEQGVVHRDLKPANVLVDESGQPKVLDFGVAHAAGTGVLGSSAHTRSGQLIGTLGYMSPEQVAGELNLVDARSDVYSLGVILYELLADRMPYQLEHLPIPEIVRVIREVDPSRLGSIDRQFRGAIETIVAKALEKEKTRRYQSAGELAADLRRHLANEPIRARPASTWYKAQRFVSRHKGLVAGACLVFAALAGATILSLISARDSQESARRARAQSYQARLAAAVSALAEHDVAAAARHLEEASKELRGWEWRHLHSRLDDRFASLAAKSGEKLFLIPQSDGIQIGRLTHTKLVLTDLDDTPIRTISFEPALAGGYVAPPTSAGLRIFDFPAGAVGLRDDHGKELFRLDARHVGAQLSPDGSKLAVFVSRERQGGVIKVYDAASREFLPDCVGHADGILAAVFSPDGKRLASVSEDRLCCLWDVATGKKIARDCVGHTSKVLSVAFRPDGARIVTTSADCTVRQWDAATGEQFEPPFDHHTGEVLAAVYSPDGEWIASGGADHTIRLWRAASRQERAVLHGHAGAVHALAFQANSQKLVSVSQDVGLGFLGDNTVGVWDLNAVDLPVLRDHTSYVYPVAYSPDGRWIASGSWDKSIRLWDAATGEECAKLPQSDIVRALAFSPDGTWLVTGSDRAYELVFWDTATGREIRRIPAPFLNIQYLAVSPDGTRLTIGAFGGTGGFHLLDVASGKKIDSKDGLALAFSPDGKWLAGRDAGGKKVVLWDSRDLRPIAPWPGHNDDIDAIAFRRDGRRLLSASKDHTVRVWDTATGKCLREFKGHTDKVYAAVFHPEGTRVASAGRDRGILIWDPDGDQDGVRLTGHVSYIWSLAFSPDGKSLVSGSGDNSVRLWDTEPLRVRYLARRDAEALRPEADRLVAGLFGQKKDAAAVVAALRADRSLSEPQRHAALRAVLRSQMRRQANAR